MMPRKITSEDIKFAIKTAKENGEVTIKTGKFGTPQKMYRGSNKVIVIEETSGRNAGKIITSWRE
jgi:hypothetical protein